MHFCKFFVLLALLSTASRGELSLRELAQSREWLALLHCSSSQRPCESEIQDSGFWLNSPFDPIQELQFFYGQIARRFLSQNSAISAEAESSSNESKSDSILCRFPARLRFIVNHQKLGDAEQLLSHCPDYQSWNNLYNLNGLTLIYSEASMVHPASVMGHLALRFEQSSTPGLNAWLAPVLQFGVDLPDDGMPNLVANGLRGQYQGGFQIIPYYAMLNKYHYLENRGIWEYHLALNSKELQLFLDHLYELKKLQFPFRFATLNCSHAILNLLTSIRPELDSHSRGTWLSPSQVCKKVNRLTGFVRDKQYIPSAEVLLRRRYNSLMPSQKAIVKKLERQEPSLYPSLEAMDFVLDELALLERWNRLSNAQEVKQRNILNFRAEIKSSAEQKLDKPPEASNYVTNYRYLQPDKALGPHQVTLTYASSQTNPAYGLSISPFQHDLIAPRGAYPLGEMTVFNLQMAVTQNESNDKYRLDFKNLQFISLQSLQPFSRLQLPLSWTFESGLWNNQWNEHFLQPGLADFIELRSSLGPGLCLASASQKTLTYTFLEGFNSIPFRSSFTTNLVFELRWRLGLQLHFFEDWMAINLEFEKNRVTDASLLKNSTISSIFRVRLPFSQQIRIELNLPSLAVPEAENSFLSWKKIESSCAWVYNW